MLFAIFFISLIIALELGIFLWSLREFIRSSLREKHSDPKERRPIVNELKKIVGIRRKGTIFIPPSERELDRQRLIEERRAQGLDTPIDMLRDQDDEI